MPAIVVVTFNRLNSLQRLLRSLERSHYPNDAVQLVISVDFGDSEEGSRLREFVNEYQWPHGPKRSIQHHQNLGLRKHVLSCGDLSQEYGRIIVLEDDLSVARHFFQFAVRGLDHAAKDERVAGISLYSHAGNLGNGLPFTPLYDGFDNYFLQIASSWGQAWDSGQWSAFRQWYDSLPDDDLDSIPSDAMIPDHIRGWPKSSWLKYFIWYLQKADKYFLYPRVSYSTNHSDPGMHCGTKTSRWQVPLASAMSEPSLSTTEQSLSLYDAFFEVKPETLRKVSTELVGHDFDVDLWGQKPKRVLRKPLTLTSRRASNPIKSFPLELKPFEENFSTIAKDDEDAYFHLVQQNDRGPSPTISVADPVVLQYLFGHLPIRQVFRNAFRYIAPRLFPGRR
ncbi:MAG: hypothetical protein AAF802_02555 [Planctomycetota bacterium]